MHKALLRPLPCIELAEDGTFLDPSTSKLFPPPLPFQAKPALKPNSTTISHHIGTVECISINEIDIGRWGYKRNQENPSHDAASLETTPDGVPAFPDAASTELARSATCDGTTRSLSGSAPVPATPEGLTTNENEDDNTENSTDERPELARHATYDNIPQGLGVKAPALIASEAITANDYEEGDSDIDIGNCDVDLPDLPPAKNLPRKSRVVLNTNSKVINGVIHNVQVFEEAKDFEEAEIGGVVRSELLLERLHRQHGTCANSLAADKLNNKRSTAMGGQSKRDLGRDRDGVKASSSGQEPSDKRHNKQEAKHDHGLSSFSMHSSYSICKEKPQRSTSSSKPRNHGCSSASSRHSLSTSSRDRSPMCKKISGQTVGSKSSSQHSKSHHDSSRASSCHDSFKLKSHLEPDKSGYGSSKAKTYYHPDAPSRNSDHHSSSSRFSSTQSAKSIDDLANSRCTEKSSKKSHHASSKISSHQEVSTASCYYSSGTSSASHESPVPCRRNSRTHGRNAKHKSSLSKKMNQHKEEIASSPQKKKLKLQRRESTWSAKAHGDGRSGGKYIALSLATVEKARTVKVQHGNQLEPLSASGISYKAACQITEKGEKKVARSAPLMMPIVSGMSSIKDCTVSLTRLTLPQKYVRLYPELPRKRCKSRSSLKPKPATMSGEHETRPSHYERNKPLSDCLQTSEVRSDRSGKAATVSTAGLSAVLRSLKCPPSKRPHCKNHSTAERTFLPHGSSTAASRTPSSAPDLTIASTASLPDPEPEPAVPLLTLPPAVEPRSPVPPKTDPHPSGPLPATDPHHSSPPLAVCRQGVIPKLTVQEKLQAFRYPGVVQVPAPVPLHNRPSEIARQFAQFRQVTTLDFDLTRRNKKRSVTPEPLGAKKRKTTEKLLGVSNTSEDAGCDASSRAKSLRSGQGSLQVRSGQVPLQALASTSSSSPTPNPSVASPPSVDDISTADLWMEIEGRGRYKACSCGMVSCNFALFFLHQSFHSHDGHFRCVECGEECVTKIKYFSHLMEMHAKRSST